MRTKNKKHANVQPLCSTRWNPILLQWRGGWAGGCFLPGLRPRWPHSHGAAWTSALAEHLTCYGDSWEIRGRVIASEWYTHSRAMLRGPRPHPQKNQQIYSRRYRLEEGPIINFQDSRVLCLPPPPFHEAAFVIARQEKHLPNGVVKAEMGQPNFPNSIFNLRFVFNLHFATSAMSVFRQL